MLSLPLLLSFPSTLSTNGFWLLSMIGDRNEIKAFLPVLCYPCQCSPLTSRKWCYSFFISSVVFSWFIHLFFTFLTKNCEVFNFFSCITFVFFFYQWRNKTYIFNWFCVWFITAMVRNILCSICESILYLSRNNQ